MPSREHGPRERGLPSPQTEGQAHGPRHAPRSRCGLKVRAPGNAQPRSATCHRHPCRWSSERVGRDRRARRDFRATKRRAETKHPLVPVAGWWLAGDAAGPNKSKPRAGMPVPHWRGAGTHPARGRLGEPSLPAGPAAHARRRRCRAGTVLRNGPQAHGSRANRATTATPVTTRARSTSTANHGCLVAYVLTDAFPVKC